EDYCRRFPELPLDDELVTEEYRARHLWGDRPAHDDYQRRFPGRDGLPAKLADIDAELLREADRSDPSAPSAPTPAPGHPTRVGAFTLASVIAAGASGVVFAATAPDGQPVAAKVIHPHLLADAESRNRFDREARLLLDLRHPNVVRVLAVERGALVMERVPGADLARRVRQSGPLPAAEAVGVLGQLAEGLAYLHARGIVHRDVSPSNAMLDPDGRVRLIDLGLAKRFESFSAPTPSGSPSSWVTPEGNALFGTPDCVAPETIRDCTSAGPAADVYGLGCVGVLLLTGQPPFPASTPLEALFRHLAAPPPDLSAHPPALTRSLLRCLAKRPEDRPTAGELAAEWRTAGLPPSVPGDQPEAE
ncbi:MAG: serine/threonine protein kinase, partial [Gemmataceae bacterium]|nr:serine/threonine protein kinase [Gemmataceae bacterium]